MRPIQVTKSFLPPLEEVAEYLKVAWANCQLTNNGQLVQQLESRLCEELALKRLLTVTNGTVALQMALEAVGATGSVITTPFSYVATTSSILWQRCQPVFVDVDPLTLCIDPAKIAGAIRGDTTAILATHVYGIPCDVHAIDVIAKSTKLSVIYDAAHAFGTTLDGRSVLESGDISTLSFHATKLFHSTEGGAVVANSSELHERLKLMRSFGHIGDEHFALGINGKMSEMHAAMGLSVLNHLEEIKAGRERVTKRYHELLDGADLRFPTVRSGVGYNYAYFPVLFRTEAAQTNVRKRLNEDQVFPRRYFFPSLNQLPYLTDSESCPISEDASHTVLSLPLFPDLPDEDIVRIARIVRDSL